MSTIIIQNIPYEMLDLTIKYVKQHFSNYTSGLIINYMQDSTDNYSIDLMNGTIYIDHAYFGSDLDTKYGIKQFNEIRPYLTEKIPSIF